MIDRKHAAKAKTATQAIFLVCGFAISSWAPMVPIAKEKLGLDDASLGLMLLMLGFGAIVMMPVSGFLSHRFGTRIVILLSGLLAALMLPLLLVMPTPVAMAAALFVFGAGIGTVDVAMNSQGVIVQGSYGKPIMSSLHGLFSVGGLCGSLGLGVLIKFGLNPVAAAVSIAVLLIAILFLKYSDLFSKEMENEMAEEKSNNLQPDKTGKGVWLNSAVIFLGLACFFVFLSEGAMLDWSALFLKENRDVDAEFAGIGYAAFSIAMAAMRLLGDKIVERFNGKTVVLAGGFVAAAGISLAVLTPWVITSLLGFVLLGLGAANIVPVFLSEGGKLKQVPAAVAIPIITTMGYAGQLAGPALLGFVAHEFSLAMAIGLVGTLLFIVSVSYGIRNSSAG